MIKTNPKVDGFIRKHSRWGKEIEQLRKIILDCGLTEDVKWRVPCYTVDDRNMLFIGPYKETVTLSFVNGALLKDPKKILKSPGEDSQSVRIIRFTSVQEILDHESVLKAYIHEAVRADKSGLRVKLKKITERPVPVELQAKLGEMPTLKTAFKALTPGRQRAYLMHFSAPKQSKTRESRVAKCIPRILDGKGLMD